MRFSTEHNFVSNIIRHPDELANVYSLVPELAITDTNLREIYECVVALWSSGDRVDEVSIYKTIRPDAGFLSQLTDKIPSKQQIPWLAKDIAKEYKRDRLDKLINNALEINKSGDPNDTIGEISKILAIETHEDQIDHSSKASMDRFSAIQERNAEHGLGIDTGFMCYEDKYIRYCPNHVWMIGGFTSTGKTAKMVEMLHKGHSDKDFKSLVISTEMTEEQNNARLIARETGLNQNYIFSGKIRGENIATVNAAKEKISNWNMKVYDSVYEFSEIEMCGRKAALQGGVDVIYIDYAQNITVSDAKSEYQENTIIAKGVQRLAKSCRCTVVLFSQLSNDAAKDDNGLLQFKGSGAYSAVADIGIILKKSKDGGPIIMAEGRKNRHGPRFKQALEFVDNWTRLKEVNHSENE